MFPARLLCWHRYGIAWQEEDGRPAFTGRQVNVGSTPADAAIRSDASLEASFSLVMVPVCPRDVYNAVIMATDVFKLLTSLGLPNIESKVYIASLKLGSDSVQNIAKEAKLSRTAAYQAIEELQKRGLISTVQKGKRTMYTAESPENAVAMFRSSVKKMEEQVALFERLLPEIKAVASGDRPSVRFYEGDEAVRALFVDVADVAPETMCEVANFDDIYAFLDADLLKDARKLLNSEKTKIRLLHHGKLRTPLRPEVQYCELLPELGEFHGDIWIYPHRVAFITFVGKPVTVIIESKPFYDTAHVLFEAAWRVCGAGKKV